MNINKRKALVPFLFTLTLFIVLKITLRGWTVADIEELSLTATLSTSSEQWRTNTTTITHNSNNITIAPAATDGLIQVKEQSRDLTEIRDPLQMTDNFPKVFIIGFAKTGTKALYETLKLHPQLSGPPTELRYFTEHYTQYLQDYINRFTPPPFNGYNVEKSPDYILSLEAARRLKSALEEVNILPESVILVVVLRNPVVRTVSDYLEMRYWALINGRSQSKFVTAESFENLILRETGEIKSDLKIVNSSCYSYHIRQWMRLFGKHQFCFVDGDRFVSDPFSEVKLLEQCLGLQSLYSQSNFIYNEMRGFYCFKGFGSEPHSLCMAKSKGRKHPTIDLNVIVKLKEFFQPWNNELYQLLDRNDFDWEQSIQY